MTAPRAVVCLPTYQERANVEVMLDALGGVLDTSRDLVLVIDDASPDGTGDVAEQLAQTLPWVSVLRRPRKEGMGPAYVAGFGWALEHGAELVVTMDCDFSHDPQDVARLLEAAADADMVIGSRYVNGGRNDDRGEARRLVSRAACLYVRAVLGMDVRDPTGGFKCLRRSALEAIGPEVLAARGYVFQVELTYRAVRAGLRVREVPIRFVERRAGESKRSGGIVAEAAWTVPALRIRALAGRL